MKKIMIAVAVAAMGAAAFGANCSPDDKPKDAAWVYQWKFTGKTTAGKKAAAKGNDSVCAPTDGAACTYRAKASLKIQGYTYACNPGCGSDAFETFAESLEVFYMTKPWKASMAGGVSTELSHIIGSNKKQYEAAGVAKFTEDAENVTYTLVYAGLGKYDLKNSRVSSVSGNFAGIASQAWAYNLKKDLCIKAGYWDCATRALVCDGPTVAFGKFSAKFKKSAAKKYATKGTAAKLPSWVKWLNK
ncbi:MAG: hypothetical protein Q4G55_01980 [bacterium]|nr:hypothetical protein [bacterium]